LLIALAILVILLNSLTADPYSESSNPFEETQFMRFDSLNVRFVGNWPFGETRAVAFDSLRNLAFCGSGAGVYILDVSNPSNPLKLSERIHSRSYVYGLYVDTSLELLYIACADAGVEIWDVADPLNPSKLSRYETPGYALDVFVSGSYAYVADWHECLRLIDISIPTNPIEVGFLKHYSVRDVYVLGSYVFMAAGSYFVIADVSDPANPHELANYHSYGSITDVFARGVHAFVTQGNVDSSGVLVFDVSTPSNPQIIGFCAVSNYTESIHISASFSYVTGLFDFYVVDISNLSNPQLAGSCYCVCNDVFVLASLAYVSGRSEGLQIIDVSSPSNPQPLGQYEIWNESFAIYVSPPLAYVACGTGGLRILDISEPLNPVETGYCEILWSASAIFVQDSFAFVCEEGEPYVALRVIDVSDPSSPTEVGSCFSSCLFGNSRGIHDVDSIAYIALATWTAFSDQGLWIVDISTPSNPQTIALFPTLDDANDVFVVDSLAYLAAEDFYILNVSDPSNPQQIGYYDCERASGVFTAGPYAYVVDNFYGFRVLNISDPSNPQEVGFCSTPGDAEKCSFDKPYAYVADGSEGFRLIDVSDPANPYEVGYYATPDHARDIFFNEPYIFVVDRDCGLQIYQFYGAGVEEDLEKLFVTQPSIKLLQNPVKGNYIELLLSSPKNSNTEIALYNLLGQKVRAYSFGNLKSGKNALRLDTKGLITGTYFLKSENLQNHKTVKIILIK
ncbi:MAG: T9SS type A sorting domain-containing protein, partial [Candidatus Cloacimonadota bacterium]